MKYLTSAKRILFRRMFLITFDITAIILSSFLSLFVRFDMNFNAIESRYILIFQKYTWIQVLLTIIIFYIFRLYHSLWAFASFAEVQNIISACFISDVLYFFFIHIVVRSMDHMRLPYSYYFLNAVFLFCFVAGSRTLYRFIRQEHYKKLSNRESINTMIVGAGEAGNMILKEIQLSKHLNLNVQCVIDDDKMKIGSYIHGVKIVGNRHSILDFVEIYHIKKIIIAMPTVSKDEVRAILEICQLSGCEIKILPGIYQLMNGEVGITRLRNIDIEDLLGRDPVVVNLESVSHFVYDKNVLITGAGGTIGSELCRQIARHRPRQIILFDIYENSVYDIEQEIKSKYPELHVIVLIGSICNRKTLEDIFSKYHPNIVYHAAAHKHVPLMESSPHEAVNNNVFGTLELVRVADQFCVERFVLISSDKAVNPTNIMGATKRICEMMIQYYNMISKTDYVAVRFGNVLGSNGSVVPLFHKQIENGGPVTVTHPDIIRYFMTIPEAVSLVLEAGVFAKGGEIFVLDMGEPVKILDLAEKMIRLSGYVPYKEIKIKFTGLRPGEKLYEELLMGEEGLKSTSNKMIYIGKPIKMDYQHFFEQLDELKKMANDPSSDIRKVIKKIVVTYSPLESKEDLSDNGIILQLEQKHQKERKIICTNT